MKSLLRFALLPVLALLAGCPSVSSLTTARTITPGKFQLTVAPGFEGFSVTSKATKDNAAVGVPAIEFGGRYGFSEAMDVGFKAGMGGIGGDLKYQFVRSPTSDSGLDLALDPGLATNFGSLVLSVPLLVGFNFSGHQLVLGPKLIDQLWFASAVASDGSGSSSASVNVLYAGASVGLSLKLSDAFRVMPEVSIGYPIADSVGNGAGPDNEYFGMMLFQVQLGLMFGG